MVVGSEEGGLLRWVCTVGGTTGSESWGAAAAEAHRCGRGKGVWQGEAEEYGRGQGEQVEECEGAIKEAHTWARTRCGAQGQW